MTGFGKLSPSEIFVNGKPNRQPPVDCSLLLPLLLLLTLLRNTWPIFIPRVLNFLKLFLFSFTDSLIALLRRKI